MQCRDLKFISAVLIRYHWWMSCHKCYVLQCRDLEFISAVLIRYHWWMSCHKCYVYQSELKI